MPDLSGLEVAVLVKELNSALAGSYVNNIFSLGRSQIIRFRTPNGEDSMVIVSPKAGAWVSNSSLERGETTQFTTKMRSLLDRAKVVGVHQMEEDRVYDFVFGEDSGVLHLIVEMLPPGNIVVTGPDWKVLLAQRESRGPARRLVLGGKFSVAPGRRRAPRQADRESLESACGKEKTAGAALGRHFAMPQRYVGEVLFRVGLESQSPSSQLSEKAGETAKVIREMWTESLSRPSPCVCTVGGRPELFGSRPMAYEVEREGATMSELCDHMLLTGVFDESAPAPGQSDSKRGELEATIEKLVKEELSLTIRSQELRGIALEARRSSLEDSKALLERIEINPREPPKSPEAAASLIFDKSKELQEKAVETGRAVADLKRKLGDLRSPKPVERTRLRKREGEWYERFRWFRTTAGKLAIGGRDAQSNQVIVKRHMDAGDVVYHADLFGSPFFVLKGGKEQTDEEIAEVAQATVAYSSAWKTGLVVADAYWVNPDQISGAAPTGEYLPKGSFMIRGRKNFVPRNRVELAVGVDKSGRVIAGPESAVSSESAAYVLLNPRREKGSETGKKVKKELEARLGTPGSVPLDEVMRAVPTGGSRIVMSRLRKPLPS